MREVHHGGTEDTETAYGQWPEDEEEEEEKKGKKDTAESGTMNMRSLLTPWSPMEGS
jgi:hypothetical protein